MTSFLNPLDWRDVLIRFIVQQPISVVDNKFFRDMVRMLKGKASIPQRRVLLARMEELLVDLQGSVDTMLRSQ
ncbi:unnamed protein product [Ascophyllum nodosum]